MKIVRRRLLAAFAGLSLFASAFGQPAGTLYDPEPPSDSAYLRVFWSSSKGNIEVWVDGRQRVSALAAGTASDYLILPAGAHTVALRVPVEKKERASVQVELQRGSATTVAFATSKNGPTPFVFEDKANSNKLKAVLNFYHLQSSSGPMNVTTGDGKLKVFSEVPFGKSASMSVNPIQVELAVVNAVDAKERGRTKLAMTQGANYSLFAFGQDGTLALFTQESKTEKYRPQP